MKYQTLKRRVCLKHNNCSFCSIGSIFPNFSRTRSDYQIFQYLSIHNFLVYSKEQDYYILRST